MRRKKESIVDIPWKPELYKDPLPTLPTGYFPNPEGPPLYPNHPPQYKEGKWSYYLPRADRYTEPHIYNPVEWYKLPEDELKKIFGKDFTNSPNSETIKKNPVENNNTFPPKKVFYNFPSPHQEPPSQSYAQAVNQMGPGMGATLNQVPRLNVVNPVYQLGGDSINPALASQLRMLMEQSQGIPYSGHHSGRRINPAKKILQYFNPALYSPDEYAEADYV